MALSEEDPPQTLPLGQYMILLSQCFWGTVWYDQLYLSSHRLYMSAAGMLIFHWRRVVPRMVSLGPASSRRTELELSLWRFSQWRRDKTEEQAKKGNAKLSIHKKVTVKTHVYVS